MKIEINFTFETRVGHPKIKIGIDRYILYDGEVKSNFILEKNLDKGSHNFFIEHYGKTKYEASTTEFDKHVHIKKIKFDDVSLDEELWNGKFYPNYLHNAHNEPKFISPNLYLGHNGKWLLTFEYPFLEWIIKKRNIGPNLKNTIFESDEKQFQDIKNFFENMKDIT